MFYGCTTDATDWDERLAKSWSNRLLRALFFFIPRANLDVETHYPLVKEWVLELSDEGWPQREVALDAQGKPLFCTPNSRNAGFWTDAPRQFTPMDLRAITAEEFDSLWAICESHRAGCQ